MKKTIFTLIAIAILFLTGCEHSTAPEPIKTEEKIESSYEIVADGEFVGAFVTFDSDSIYSEIKIIFYFQEYTKTSYLPNNHPRLNRIFFYPISSEELPLIIDVKVYGIKYE